jgi:RNA polymerase sigma factor (sigma-70 family)
MADFDERVRDLDSPGFRGFVERLIRRFHPRDVDADDVIQLVRIACHEASVRDAGQPIEHFKCFAQTVATRQVISLVRRATSTTRKATDSDAIHLDRAALDRLPAPDAESPAEVDERHELLERALAEIPARERDWIIAIWLDGQSVSSVAGRAGISPSRVYRIQLRAFEHLRVAMLALDGKDY